jgi:histidinol-phosphate aminotransferase
MFNRKTLVPDYLRNLKTYQAGKPIEEVVREKGLSRISKLASNENPNGASPKVIEAIQNALKDIHRYPDMHAHNLKKELCEIYKLKPENIILGNGSEGIMAYIVRAFLQPGDVVLTAENTFIGFYILAGSVGAKVEKYPLTPKYTYDLMTIAYNINEKTKVIYLANPNNPTGTYFTKQSFDNFMKHVPDHVLVIMDEAYFEFAMHDGHYDEFPDSMDYRYDNVITLRTFSKAYGISGLRVGYGFAHEDLIHSLTKVKLPFEPNSLGQVAALAALKDKDHLTMGLELNQKLRTKTFRYLESKDFNPIKSVTNFVTFKTGSEEASSWMFEELLNHGVIIRALKANDMPDYVRVSIGTEAEMNHYFEAMDKILPEYDKRFGRP